MVFKSWLDECIVVAGVRSSSVYQDGMKVILVDNICSCDFAFSFWSIWQQRLKVKHVLELKLQVLLYDLLNVQIVLIPLQRYLQNRWQLLESDELECILLAEVISLILVLSIEPLLFDILFDALFDVGVASDPQLNCVELVVARGLVLNVDALDHVLSLALEEAIVGSFDWCVLHLLVELVAEDAVELVDVLLLVDVLGVPAESLKQLVSSDEGCVAELEVIKDSLEAERNRAL